MYFCIGVAIGDQAHDVKSVCPIRKLLAASRNCVRNCSFLGITHISDMISKNL